LKDETLILAHDFKGIRAFLLVLMYLGRTLLWQEPVAEEVFYLMKERKQREMEKTRARDTL
jgi:hypothetical protein